MAIDRRPNGRYRARYRGPDRRTRSKTFDRKIDAQRWLTEQRGARDRGQWVDPAAGRVTLGELAPQWLERKRRLKPKTLASYESLLGSLVLPEFGELQLHQIDQPRVQGWVGAMTDRGLSPSRIRQAHQVLRAALGAAVGERRIGWNPAVGVEIPRDRHRETLFLNMAQGDRLAEETGPFRPLVLTLALCGIRWGEAVGLQVGKVNLLHRRLEITETLSEVAGRFEVVKPKNHRDRSVVAPRPVTTAIEPLVAGRPAEHLVFTAARGGPLRHSNFLRRVWQPAVAAARLPSGLRIHDLRHTAAALLISEGAHPKAVQSHLGHSSIQVTMDRYGHLFPEAFEDLAGRLEAAWEAQVVSQECPGVVSSLEESRMG